MPVSDLVYEKEAVETTEELEKWKAERAKRRKQSGTSVPPPMLSPEQRKSGWGEDVSALIVFLQGVKTLMKFLIDHRVPEKPAQLFTSCLTGINQYIDDAISDINDIRSEEHIAFEALRARGLTGKPLKLKLREYYGRITNGPAVSVLERVDSILGSLIPVLGTLEPVKEFKEALESRLKHGGDREIISLNLSGNEQLWNAAEEEA